MMGLFIICKLLLVTLLLQPTEEELKFGEFCLRLANDSHWTSTESPDQPKSSHPTKQATQQLEQPTAETTASGCRCQEEEKKPLNDRLIISVTTTYPSESCNSYESIVSLKDNKVFCVTSNRLAWEKMLMKLETLRPRTPKNIIVGCRCPEIGQKPPTDLIPARRTMIWPISEACSYIELIETLMDGREMCVTPESFLQNLRVPRPEERGQRGESGKSGMIVISGERNVIGGTRERPEVIDPIISGIKNTKEDHHVTCTTCIPFESWNLIDPKDVRSVKMERQPFHCPDLIHVSLKSEVSFCVDSSQPSFRALLEKLDV